MAPPRKHDTDTILDAVRALALRDGPRAVSVAAIARESGAPVGTLYHRFRSRDGLVSAAWKRALERFHAVWLEAARDPEPGPAMAVSVITFARTNPEDAQLLLTLRRRDLLDAHGDAPILNTAVHEQIARLAGSDRPARARPRHPRDRRHPLRRRPPPRAPLPRLARGGRRRRRPRAPKAHLKGTVPLSRL